jgi:hypothetical protein
MDLMNMAEPFTDDELQNLAARESKARQHIEESSKQPVYSRGSQVSRATNPTVNDEQYKAEFKATKHNMSEAEYVSLRRAEDGLEPFIPDKPPAPATPLAMNPLASGL